MSSSPSTPSPLVSNGTQKKSGSPGKTSPGKSSPKTSLSPLKLGSPGKTSPGKSSPKRSLSPGKDSPGKISPGKSSPKKSLSPVTIGSPGKSSPGKSSPGKAGSSGKSLPGKSGSPGKYAVCIPKTSKEMNTYRTLEGGFKIPTIGLGTSFSENQNIEKAIEVALSLGYRHIDTAYMYSTEKPVGKVINEWLRTGEITREEIFVTSKLPFHGAGHPDAVEFFLKISLENLQLDYLDLYLIHFPVGFNFKGDESFDASAADTDHEALWKAMEKQVDAGKIKYIGLSNFNVRQIDRIMKIARIMPACLQVEMHVLLQQQELVEYCRNNNIVLVAYAPLGSPDLIKLKDIMAVQIVLPNLLGNNIVVKIAEKHKKNTCSSPDQISNRKRCLRYS
ncbi:unnamed protein product [Psylliodes chrysocephalus]|uniref:NADP-dependent oxidoreductase domain-containing protein n=1 Tax=Psylliodes chrysocephalus TaxID=3402493 RepID=A0A9P0CMI5_9CUCU|nr:unnamed protein product [Psylliodes chrysocephala]